MDKGDDEAVAWMTTLEDHSARGGYNTPPAVHGVETESPASNGGVMSQVDEAAEEAAGASGAFVVPDDGIDM